MIPDIYLNNKLIKIVYYIIKNYTPKPTPAIKQDF